MTNRTITAHYLLFAGAMASLLAIFAVIKWSPHLIDGICIGLIIGWFFGAFSVINALVQSGKL